MHEIHDLQTALSKDPTLWAGKKVLVRVDFNAPMRDGLVTDMTRLDAAIPTTRALSEAGAIVILLAHYERPKGKIVPEYSLAPIAKAYAERLGQDVTFVSDCVGDIACSTVDRARRGEVLLLQNLRFHAGEEANAPAFVAQLAQLGDYFVQDAFSATHRAHASTEGLARALPSYAGLALARELHFLDQALGKPNRPVLAIVGGAKVSTKIDVLTHLTQKVDQLAIGGAMANTFLAAQGHEIGKSLCELDCFDIARSILLAAQVAKCEIILPQDVIAARKFAAHAPNRSCDISELESDELILDCGPKFVSHLTKIMETSRTIVWNGPLGAFETSPFDRATIAAAQAAARFAKTGQCVVVAGGGDTVAALNLAGVKQDFTFVSTAGGAFLEWLEGKSLPGIAALLR